MIFEILDILGLIAFAISGTLIAIEKKLDIFGVFIIALVTSIGGGTLRDVLIGHTPVTWLTNLQTFYVIFFSTIGGIIFRKKLNHFRTSIFLFDTIGIGVFTLIGIEKALLADLHPIMCVLLGTFTACFGGVIRDILCNEIPVLFHKEIYATACMAGGILFFILKYFGLNDDIVYVATAGIIVLIRILAVKKNWSFPTVTMN